MRMRDLRCGQCTGLLQQPNMGPTTRSQTQGQQEQGTKRANEEGDQSDARKRSRFMRMARRLQKKGFEVTCPAEF